MARLGSSALRPLLEALESEEIYSRRKAVSILGAVREKRAWREVAERLKDANGEVRRKAAWALARMEEEKAVPYLVSALDDDDREVRSAAASALDRLGWEPSGVDEKVLYLVAVGRWDKLADMGEAAEEAARRRLEDPDEEVREGAASVLEIIKSRRGLKDLLE